MDRRDFAKLIAGGAALTMFPSAVAGSARAGVRRVRQEMFFGWESLRDGVWAVTGQGGNVLLYQSGGEALISDSKNLGFGATLRREAEAHGANLTYAVNTHHHGDHVGGNAAFTEDIPLVSHRNAQDRIRSGVEGAVGQATQRAERALGQLRQQNADPAVIEEIEAFYESLASTGAEAFVPTEAVARERELTVGGSPVELRYVNSGHTDNDLFLYLPEENVIHAGDLFFNARHPFIDVNSGATTEGWQRCLLAMIAVADDNTVVIPGHGAISDRNGLQRQWEYFGQLRDAVSEAIDEGVSRDAVGGLQPSTLSDIQGSPARNLGVVYDELAGGQ